MRREGRDWRAMRTVMRKHLSVQEGAGQGRNEGIRLGS